MEWTDRCWHGSLVTVCVRKRGLRPLALMSLDTSESWNYSDSQHFFVTITYTQGTLTHPGGLLSDATPHTNLTHLADLARDKAFWKEHTNTIWNADDETSGLRSTISIIFYLFRYLFIRINLIENFLSYTSNLKTKILKNMKKITNCDKYDMYNTCLGVTNPVFHVQYSMFYSWTSISFSYRFALSRSSYIFECH